MNSTTLTKLLQIAALLHLGLIWAGASMPRAVQLHSQLAGLVPFVRRLFFVYFSFIGMLLAGFGILTFLYAPSMAAGQPVARGLCVLLAIFWVARLIVATFVFDVRPYLTNWFYRFGYQILNLIFVYLAFVYILAGWKGGHL